MDQTKGNLVLRYLFVIAAYIVPPPFAFIIYNPTMELGGVLVPTYRNRVVIFLVGSSF